MGVFVALGIAALLGLAMKVGNLTSSKIGETYSVTAAFENIGGLKPHAPVKSAGVVVGRIANISFDDKTYQATVTMTIEDAYKLTDFKPAYGEIFQDYIIQYDFWGFTDIDLIYGDSNE